MWSNRSNDGIYELDGWSLFGMGGATAHGLLNDDSQTQSRLNIINALDGFDGPKDVYLMFGEVDCTNHIIDTDGADATLKRYGQFATEILAREDVSTVYSCTVYPRSVAFFMNNRKSSDHKMIIEYWNDRITNPVDIYTKLLADDGFICDDLAQGPRDPGERHLSEGGNAAVWMMLKAHHSASVI